MVTRSASETPEATAASPFQGLGAGFDFFKDWMKAASTGLPNLAQAVSQPGSAAAPSWVLPTLDAQELEKRLHDLKAVKFWLEQNTNMVDMTIQTLEVQRMTLETLKGMNVPVDALKDSLKSAAGGAGGNPLAWWETLSKQFADMTQKAVQESAKAAAVKPPTVAKTAARKTVSKTTPKPSTKTTSGKSRGRS